MCCINITNNLIKGDAYYGINTGYSEKTLCAAAALCMTAAPLSVMLSAKMNATAAVYGDVNSDGKADIGDVISLSRFLTILLMPVPVTAADQYT